MKEQIFKLREEGLSYNQIQSILNCSKGTISYHLGKDVKRRTLARQKNRKSLNGIDLAITMSLRRDGYTSRRHGGYNHRKSKGSLVLNEAKEVFEMQTGKCYLTGLDLLPETITFDHIVPVSKGGLSNKENLGLTSKTVNYMKTDLSVVELLNYCELILSNFGFQIIRPDIIQPSVKSNVII